MGSIDKEIMKLYCEISPASAYLQGFEEYSGKVFIPSKQNVEQALKSVEKLRKSAEDKLQEKILDSIEAGLLFEEPQSLLDEIVGSIYAHLVKQGVRAEKLLELFDYCEKAIDAAKERFEKKEITSAVKILTLYRVESAAGIIDSVKKETRSGLLKKRCDSLKQKVMQYASMFKVDGFDSGLYENVVKIFERDGFELGRQEFYLTALKKGLDYSESPDELEQKALAWIREELPLFQEVTSELSEIYKCKNDAVVVEKEMNKRLDLFKLGLVKTTKRLRSYLMPIINRRVCRITKNYSTRVIETPSYLTSTIPTGAAQFFDTFKKRPFNIFFQTTDERRDPDRSIAFLTNLLVHEEYGHCVHHSNSASNRKKVRDIELITVSTSGPISEGLSFNRELEFYNVSKQIEENTRNDYERNYVRFLESFGGIKLFNKELEFATRRWRLTRFLRVVGDVRINTGKQGIVEFTEWAEKETGVPRSSVYFQIYPAHEGMFPGYATSYAVLGQEIKQMEERIKDEQERVRFSTYLCSIGFPPRTIYRSKLESYLNELAG